MSAENYARLINNSGNDRQDTAIMTAMLQSSPAARLAVWHNSSLTPSHKIERHLIDALNDAYEQKDVYWLREAKWRLHRIQSLIADTMLDDLEKQGQENYSLPWWAAI